MLHVLCYLVLFMLLSYFLKKVVILFCCQNIILICMDGSISREVFLSQKNGTISYFRSSEHLSRMSPFAQETGTEQTCLIANTPVSKTYS